MSLFVSMHFILDLNKLDINVWVFISAFFLLSPHLAPKDLSLFTYMLSDYAMHFLNDT